MPYRSRGRKRETRRLRFFHGRFLVSAVLALFALVALMSCVTTPRTITVECEPISGPIVECTSVARSLWGTNQIRESLIEGSTRGIHDDRGQIGGDDLALNDDGEHGENAAANEARKDSEFAALELSFAYSKRSKSEAHERLEGRLAETGNFTPITQEYPRSAHPLFDLFRFQAELRVGRPAQLVYDSGWGGLISFAYFTPIIVLWLWLISGSSTLIHHVDERLVEIRTKTFWHSRAQQKRLGRDQIEDAVVTATPAHKGGTVYRPALRLTSSDLVHFGTLGAISATRAERLVGRLRSVLDLPDAPVATIVIGPQSRAQK